MSVSREMTMMVPLLIPGTPMTNSPVWTVMSPLLRNSLVDARPVPPPPWVAKGVL